MANLTINLAQLQDKIKRDRAGYKDEFETQLHRYKTGLELFQKYPDSDCEQLVELINFIASVSHCYKEEMASFGTDLIDIMNTSGENYSSKFRNEIVKALILLRGKEMVPAQPLYELFFKLFRVKDKKIREVVHKFIVRDVKKINQKTKNHQVNKNLQNFMYNMLQDQDVTAAYKSLTVTEELYKKQLWNDEKTVSVISSACFHQHQKVQSRAINFFLGQDQKDEDADSSDDEDPEEKRQREKNEEKLPNARDIMVRFAMKKGPRQKKKKAKLVKKLNKKSNKPIKRDVINFSAIDMLRDPQDFAEKLFKQLDKTNGDFEIKLIHIRLIARVIGVHKLVLFNFYPFLQRFITPQQRDVTLILQAAAHATHDLVPPEIINELARCIANNFITERNAGEVMAVGLNTVREVATRNPLAIGEDLLQDLVQYKKHIDRGVTSAAKGLLTFYRQEAPMLLAKKDRGKPTEAQRQIVLAPFGANKAKEFLDGVETLPMENDEEAMDVEENEDKEKDWADGVWKDVERTAEEDLDEDEIKARIEKEKEREEKIGRDELLKMKTERAKEISMGRILTQEEHQKIKAEQAMKGVVDIRRNLKSQLETSNSANKVSLSKIETVSSRRKHDKESRLATVLAGREDRPAYGKAKRQKYNPNASTTNKDKKKNQPFFMIKHKVSKKQSGRSYAQKKKALSESLKKQIKAYKH